MRINELLELAVRLHPSWASSTVADKRGTVRRLGDIEADSVTPLQAHELYAAWVRDAGESTARKHVRTLKALYAYAVKLELLSKNPWSTVPSTPPAMDTTWRYIPLDELDELLPLTDSADTRRAILIARYAGLRRGEIIRLSWQDIDYANRTIRVQHEGQRTNKRRRRDVPLSDELAERLERSYSVAAVSITASTLEKNLARLMARYHRPYAKPLHDLRKSIESDWLARFPPYDVAKWLGHSARVSFEHYHQATPGSFLAATRKAQA